MLRQNLNSGMKVTMFLVFVKSLHEVFLENQSEQVEK